MAGIEGIDIDAAVKTLKAKRAELVELLRKVDKVLEAFDDLGGEPMAAPARNAGGRRFGGPGRPPKAESARQTPAGSASPKPPKRKARKGRKRKPPTEKQLAAMAKARAALAAKRATAAAS